jgi:pilus assembly protein CpaF
LEALLKDDAITDVLVDGPGPVVIERSGRLQECGVELDRDQILRAIERLVSPLGLHADRSHPIVDARLADGTRVAVVLDPVAPDGPLLALRRHHRGRVSLSDWATHTVVGQLREGVAGAANIVVYGATGAGKTTLLNTLGSEIPKGERVVVIEDTAELAIQGPRVVRLEARPGTSEGVGRVDMGRLVRAALRLRPDRIIVGEVRGGEAADMIWALSTGHRGSMSTVHAADPQDALDRLEVMVVLGLGESVPLAAARRQVHRAIDLLVGVARRSDGSRTVTAVHRCGREGLEPARSPS